MALTFDIAREHPLAAEVVIVDDQTTSRIIFETIVRSIGDNIRVRSFDNAPTALRSVEAAAPDLIIADYKMPEMDGVEFTRRVREIPSCRDVPIVIITIVSDKAVLYEALEAGATDFLTKPVDHYECKVRCRNLLTMRRQQIIIRNRARSLETRLKRDAENARETERETLLRLARAWESRGSGGTPRARIGAIAGTIARELDMKDEFCESIELAATLHDLGMLAIPDSILLKPGPLTPAETRVMHTHVRIGHEILRDSASSYMQMAAGIALNHHESFDGTGYPAGLKGEEIPLPARITAVADVFDALLSERPYKPAWPVSRTLDELLGLKGRKFDPQCVDALITRIDELLAFRAGPANGTGNSQ
jgi:two-component system response regulator RpfG